jgi:hypothetical protein
MEADGRALRIHGGRRLRWASHVHRRGPRGGGGGEAEASASEPEAAADELARIEFNQAVSQKLYEYDPKLGTSGSTRAWFLDLTKVDIDEQSIILNSRPNLCICGSNRVLVVSVVISWYTG